MISEVEFFHGILEEFLCLDNQRYKNEIWMSNSIIKLMLISDKFEDQTMIAESLKIILNLCRFKECGELFDPYELESHPINEIAETEKNLLKSILKAEFT